MKKRKQRKWLSIFGLFFGLMVIAYYPVAELYSAWNIAKMIESMDHEAAEIDDSEKQEILRQARAYNQKLGGEEAELPYDQILPYEKQLLTNGMSTAFGTLIIPKLAMNLPIYHGTSDTVLSAGVGHLEWSSLPVGGVSSHALLSAHSGMTNMRAFDDIHDLNVGDVFGIRVLGDLYTYRITDTEVVLPEEIQSTYVVKGKDLCTLITCTPYGVNSHRLLVHGERCEVPDDFLETKMKIQDIVTNKRVWPFLLAFIVVISVLIIFKNKCSSKKKGRKTKNEFQKRA